MSHTVARQRHPLSIVLLAFITLALGLTLTVGTQLRPPTSAAEPPRRTLDSSFVIIGEDVVLPGRVTSAIDRTVNSLDRAEGRIDDDRPKLARRSLAAVVKNLRRANRAALHQINAAPADEEAETTPGPDSVVAVLTLEQVALIRLSGMYDGLLHRPRVVASLNKAMGVTYDLRLKLLKKVIGLDPEGAGADYADGMADTVDGYADEVTAIKEALKYDSLAPAARKGLKTSRTRSTKQQARVTNAFGGGE